MTILLKLKCDFLVDQGRYFGKDPIGYACFEKAVAELPTGHLICQGCLDRMAMNPDRLTPKPIFGRAAQEEAIQAIVERWKDFPKP